MAVEIKKKTKKKSSNPKKDSTISAPSSGDIATVVPSSETDVMGGLAAAMGADPAGADISKAAADILTNKHELIDIEMLDPQPNNPNEMSDRQFNMLVQNMQRVGFTDPIFVRPKENGRFEIIGGEHRWRAGKVLGLKQVPCTIADPAKLSEDEVKFQVVRHNIIKGKMSPKKFLALYESLSKEYSEEVAAESFGFVEEEEFRKLIKTTAESLPPELKEQFKEAAKEIKTLDDLAKILNHILTNYGDTLDHNYLIFDWNGKESIWIRMEKKMRANFDTLAARCRKDMRAMDHVIAGILEYALAEESEEALNTIFTSAKEVKIKADAPVPTLDFLDEHLNK